MPIATCMGRLGTETAFEVLQKATELERGGATICHLEIGEPFDDTDPSIIAAAADAMHQGFTHYTPSAGIRQVREVLARHLSTTRGLSISPDNVVIAPGAKPFIYWALLTCVEPGDEVIYPEPGFPIYRSLIEFIGAKPVPMHIRPENDFDLDVDELRDHLSSKTRLVIINSPHNPTGGVASQAAIKDAAELLVGRDLYVLSDEVYAPIIYDGAHHSIAAQPGMLGKTIIMDGHSKPYAMTGWRLGYCVAPAELVPHFTRLNTNVVSCTAAFVQVAGGYAVEHGGEIVRQRVEALRTRRDLLVGMLNEIPDIVCPTPAGAFYLFPDVSRLGRDIRELETELLERAGVAVLAGTRFGSGGEGHLRLAYARSIEELETAANRIREYLRG